MGPFLLEPQMADTPTTYRPEGSALRDWRLTELERRVGRIEAFLLGLLCSIALAVMGGLYALLKLPTGGL